MCTFSPLCMCLESVRFAPHRSFACGYCIASCEYQVFSSWFQFVGILYCFCNLAELAEITGIAAILRFPMPDIEQVEMEEIEMAAAAAAAAKVEAPAAAAAAASASVSAVSARRSACDLDDDKDAE